MNVKKTVMAAVAALSMGALSLTTGDASAHPCTHPECGGYDYLHYSYPGGTCENGWQTWYVKVWGYYVVRCDMPPGQPGNCSGQCASGFDPGRDCFQYEWEDYSDQNYCQPPD
jgi:hypothetical protein